MMHICFFITHKTLALEHCILTFQSLAIQNKQMKFDKLYIYNSHKDELPNELILQQFNEFKLYDFFANIEVFDYDETSNKTLGQDIYTISSYCKKVYSDDDRILFLKSDCLLSKLYFDNILNLPSELAIFFTAPFICAKKRVHNDEILYYISRETFTRSDDITFFVEDAGQSVNNDFNNGRNVTIYDEIIKFTSCYVIRDWSCHLISVGLLHKLRINSQSWGGVNLSELEPYFVKTDNCFVVHKYHNIQSENRADAREGPVESWLLS